MISEAYAGKSVLITGGLGFIGSNLARRLVGIGARVTLVDSLIPEYGGNAYNIRDIAAKVAVNVCDVRDRYAMEYLLRSCAYLFNLAGQTSHLDSMEHPEKDLEINAAAQLSILESCRRVNPAVRIVFASTRQLYGKPQYLPVDESHPINPVDVNGINKLAGEYYHLLYSSVYGIPACALRLTNTYGPGMRVKDARQTFLGVWIRCAIEDQPVPVYGSGAQLRDFNFVDDCVEALLIAGADDRAIGQVFNLGSDEVVSLIDLASKLTRIAGGGQVRVVEFPAARKAIDIGDYFGDFSRIRDTLGWAPVTSLEEGIGRTVEYYREHRNAYWA